MKVVRWPRPLVWAVILAIVASSFGVIAALLLQLVLGLEGDVLYMWVGIAIATGGVVAQVFAAPWFTRWLDERPDIQAYPTLEPAKVEAWTRLLRQTVLNQRVLGRKSQREQMVRDRDLMPLKITQDLDLRSSSSGKTRLRLGGDRQDLSQLVRDWEESPGRLVILGEPGYGKTFAALALIEHVNRGADESRVAELFPLVDWHLWSRANPETTIEEWLIHELSLSDPPVPTAVTWSLISSGALIPIFDGLDEVPAADRIACRNALEAYAGRAAPKRPFVVTCRHDEYLELAPKWIGADHQVSLTGLPPADIAAVIRRDAPPTPEWEEVAAAVENGDAHLGSLLRSPLRLAAAIDVYESGDPRQLIQLAPEADAEERLWDQLLATEDFAYEESDPEQTRSWLSFLAGSMRSHRRQRLWLHELYLYGDPRDRHRFFLLGAAIFMLPPVVNLCFTRSVFGFLVTAVIFAWVVYLYHRKKDKPLPLPVRNRTSLANYLKAVPDALLVGLVVGFLWLVLMIPLLSVVDLASHLWEGQTVSLEHAVSVALILSLYSGLSVAALAVGSSVQEEGSFAVAEEPPRHLAGRGPGAVIRATRNHAIVATGVGLPLLVLINLLAWGSEQAYFIFAIGVVTIGWSNFETWSFYHWTRWRLARAGYIPRRLRHFLDWMANDSRLLRVSDSYEFRHRTLLEHLARGTSPVGAANVSLSPAPRVSSPNRVRSIDFQLPKAEEEAAPNEEMEQRRNELASAGEEVRLHPDDAEAAAKLGLAHNRAGDPLAALPLLKQAVELDPTDPRHAANLASVLSTLGWDKSALELIEEAMNRSDQGTRELRGRREWVLRNLRARASSIEMAEAVVEAKPDDPMGWWDLARANEQAGLGGAASESRRRAVEASLGSKQTAIRLGNMLVVAGFSGDAVRVASSLRDSQRNHERAAILAHGLADLGDASASEQHRKAIESQAVNATARTSATVLNSLALVLLSQGRWNDASLAIDRAREKDPDQIVYAFTAAEVQLASGKLPAAREALSSALEKAREIESQPGDPTWICRILWQHGNFARRDLAIEMVIEEFGRQGFDAELVAGLIEGTPTSLEQTGWNPKLLGDWCAEWGHHSEMRRGIGIVQRLASNASKPLNSTPA